jgi:hypothetical protein
MVVIWLNIGDYNQATNDGAHIVLNQLISSCLELNSFHELPYHIMSYFIIDLDIQCKWTFTSTKGAICVHVFMITCMILLVSMVLGANLVVYDNHLGYLLQDVSFL